MIDRANDIARTLMAAWEKAEGEKVNPSYVATFADMARAVDKKFGYAEDMAIHRMAEALRAAADVLDDHTNCSCEDAARGSHLKRMVDSKWLRDRADTLDRAGGKNAAL